MTIQKAPSKKLPSSSNQKVCLAAKASVSGVSSAPSDAAEGTNSVVSTISFDDARLQSPYRHRRYLRRGSRAQGMLIKARDCSALKPINVDAEVSETLEEEEEEKILNEVVLKGEGSSISNERSSSPLTILAQELKSKAVLDSSKTTTVVTKHD